MGNQRLGRTKRNGKKANVTKLGRYKVILSEIEGSLIVVFLQRVFAASTLVLAFVSKLNF
jgi:hypothetical protein